MRRIIINDDITNFYSIGVYCGDPGNVTKATRQSSQFEPTFRLIIMYMHVVFVLYGINYLLYTLYATCYHYTYTLCVYYIIVYSIFILLRRD